MVVAKDTPVTDNRLERILAFMVAAAIGLSIICFLAVIIATAVGTTPEAFSQGVWPTVIVLPAIGLPLGLVLVITLIIVSAVRRGRKARDAGK